MIDSKHISEMTIDELMTRLREEMRTLVRDAVREALVEHEISPLDQLSILDIPLLHVDPSHPALTILSREDMYGDDGR